MTLKRVAAGAIIRNQRLLVARRKPGESLEGYWELPGGKFEPGETPEQCLRRELQEELGLKVEVIEPLCVHTHHYPRVSIELHVFVCSTENEPELLESHDRVTWAELDTLREFEWAPADLPALGELITRGHLGLSLRS